MRIQAREFVREHELSPVSVREMHGGCPVSFKTALNIRDVICRLVASENGFELEGFEELWDCTTCYTCTARCPKEVNPMEVMIKRSAVVEGGRIPNTVKVALQSVFTQGNPLTFAREDRDAWVGDLKVRLLRDAPGAEYLYFVGCTPSYDPRIQGINTDTCAGFQPGASGLCILGQEESCWEARCVDWVRRVSFEMLVEENVALWQESMASRRWSQRRRTALMP
jgi:Fe-S oxidoreductase